MACFGRYVTLPRLAPVAHRDPWAVLIVVPARAWQSSPSHINVWPDHHYPGWSAQFVSPSLLHQVRSSRFLFQKRCISRSRMCKVSMSPLWRCKSSTATNCALLLSFQFYYSFFLSSALDLLRLGCAAVILLHFLSA
jgi:hypothetical protein